MRNDFTSLPVAKKQLKKTLSTLKHSNCQLVPLPGSTSQTSNQLAYLSPQGVCPGGRYCSSFDKHVCAISRANTDWPRTVGQLRRPLTPLESFPSPIDSLALPKCTVGNSQANGPQNLGMNRDLRVDVTTSLISDLHFQPSSNVSTLDKLLTHPSSVLQFYNFTIDFSILPSVCPGRK